MDRKREIFEKVLALVRNELWEEPLACSIVKEDVRDILQVAKEQMVSGLVANSIIRNHLPIGDDLTLEVCAIQQLHEKKGREMNAEVAQFAGFLNRRNLQYVIMKGQTMAVLYPNPLMRSTGDIDFYCPKECFEEAKNEIEERLHIAMGAWDDTKHLQFNWGGLEYEMHSSLTVFGSRKHQSYWESTIDDKALSGKSAINGNEVKVLEPTINAAFLFVHAFSHFIEEGVRLKQLCDWAVFLHNMRDEIDRDYLRTLLEGIGHKKAFSIFGSWAIDKLGMPQNDFPLPHDSEKWIEKLTNSFLSLSNSENEGVRDAGGKAGLFLLLKRTRWVFRQAYVFYQLAPREVFGRCFEMAGRQIRLRLTH